MRAARGEMVIDEEWLVESPAGEKKWIRASASSLRDSGGRHRRSPARDREYDRVWDGLARAPGPGAAR